MTYLLWFKNSHTDTLREINLALTEWNSNKAHTQTTEQVAMELDKETTINETQMSNVIDKMIEDKLTKQKNQLHKNFLADLKKSQRSEGHTSGSNKLKSSLKISPRSENSSLKTSTRSERTSTQQKSEQRVCFQQPPRQSEQRTDSIQPRTATKSKQGKDSKQSRATTKIKIAVTVEARTVPKGIEDIKENRPKTKETRETEGTSSRRTTRQTL
jgi:hypothetical protein